MIDWSEVVDEKLEEGHSVRKETDVNKFHASWLGKCKRQIYNSKAGLSEFDRHSLGSMKVGTLIHSWFADDVELEGVDNEISVSQELVHNGERLKLVGRFDAADEEAVYDFKTTAGIRYVRNSPKDYHIAQLMCYMYCTGKRKGKLVYVSKSDMEVVEHEVHFDKEWFEGKLDKLVEVKQAFQEMLDHGELDRNPFEKCGCWLCRNE